MQHIKTEGNGNNNNDGLPRIFQLAADIPDFVNRKNELSRFLECAGAARDRKITACPLLIITGPAGVGKSRLAIHGSHQLLTEFPDGVIHIDCHGRRGAAAETEDLLAELLIELGVPPEVIGHELDQRARQFRDQLSRRRMLLLLDNVASEDQVRPLLPGSPGCATIVTSRSHLTGLEGATSIELNAFSMEASTELYQKVGGSQGVQDPETVEEILRLTAGLPLAVRIVAKRAARGNAARLLALLRTEPMRALRVGDQDLSSAFNSSYDTLSPSSQITFSLLSDFDIPDFAASLVEAIQQVTYEEAQFNLDELQEANLIETVGESPIEEIHYKYHELVRAFASTKLSENERSGRISARHAARKRGVSAYLSWIEVAEQSVTVTDVHRLRPRPTDHRPAANSEVAGSIAGAPLQWFAYCRQALLAILRQSFEWQMHLENCLIAEKLSVCLESRVHWDVWTEALGQALQSSTLLNDQVMDARLQFRAGDALLIQERFAEAERYLEQCLAAFTDMRMARECAQARLDLGYAALELERLADAEHLLSSCLDYFTTSGDMRNAGEAACDLAVLRQRQGRVDEAVDGLLVAARDFSTTGMANWLAFAVITLARLNASMRDPHSARRYFAASIPLLDQLNSSGWTAHALNDAGKYLRWTRDRGLAQRALRRSSKIFRDLGDDEAADRAEHGSKWWHW